RYSDLAGTQKVGTTTNTYDGGLLKTIVQKDGAGTTLASYSYVYDTAGRLISKTENGTTTPFGYDSTSQLTSAGSKSYTYDPNGNPTSGGATVGSNNQMTSDGTWTYSYDSVGNVIRRVSSSNAQTWTYSYDNANELVSATLKDSANNVLVQATYTYDV